MPELDEANDVLIILDVQQGTAGSVRKVVTAPDNIVAAFERAVEAVSRFNDANHWDLDESLPLSWIEPPGDRELSLSLGQYTNPSDVTTVLAVLENAILGVDPIPEADSGPSQ